MGHEVHLTAVWFSPAAGSNSAQSAPATAPAQKATLPPAAQTAPPSAASPPDTPSSDASDCSKTDTSPEAVFHCVNAARMNPRAFTDGYKCNDWQSWIDGVSSPARPALTTNSRLTSSADGHAKDMASHSTVTHSGSDGSTVAQRIAAAGYSTFPQAENVAGGQQSAYQVTMEWMCSKGHRETITNCNLDSVGTGVASDPSGRLYYAQNFGCSTTNGCHC